MNRLGSKQGIGQTGRGTTQGIGQYRLGRDRKWSVQAERPTQASVRSTGEDLQLQAVSDTGHIENTGNRTQNRLEAIPAEGTWRRWPVQSSRQGLEEGRSVGRWNRKGARR